MLTDPTLKNRGRERWAPNAAPTPKEKQMPQSNLTDCSGHHEPRKVGILPHWLQGSQVTKGGHLRRTDLMRRNMGHERWAHMPHRPMSRGWHGHMPLLLWILRTGGWPIHQELQLSHARTTLTIFMHMNMISCMAVQKHKRLQLFQSLAFVSLVPLPPVLAYCL